jgi:hypothetical protein
LKYLQVGRAGPDSLADEAVGEEEDEKRNEEVCKRKVENVLGGCHPGRKAGLALFKYFC